MDPLPPRPPRNTGPIELRDFGPMGRRLGTFDDCYDGSPWELHRGELVEQMGSKDIHGIVMVLVAALFRTHARDGFTVMTDVYCDLSDAGGPSLRAPDVVVVSDLSEPRNEAYRGTPLLAVEIRGTQSKRYLEEKVRLYLDHDWPWIWIAHAERHELEVFRRGEASVTYLRGAEVPLLPELDKHGLRSVPVAALFDENEATRVLDGWVAARSRADAILSVLKARGIVVSDRTRKRILSCSDLSTLDRWLGAAATTATAEAFARAIA
jgi:Uma2 family endonuclease